MMVALRTNVQPGQLVAGQVPENESTRRTHN